jgi:hypothetical protein
MLFVLLVFVVALFVAITAAWFSIIGLMAIFAGSAISIAVMAGGLEAAKLLTASWLYRNWDESPGALKYPLTAMTVILMIITSLGIFGFLSKAHIEQGAPVGNNIAKIERLDQRIAREQKIVDDATSVVLQLDDAVKTLIEYDRIRGPNGSIAVRESQKEERATLSATIDEAQDNIDKLTDEKFALQSEVRAFEVEVGPIKYVADIIYGPDAGKTAIESAVQWLIIIIIFVFDPLAILLLIAANYSLIDYGLKLRPKDEREKIRQKYSNKSGDETKPNGENPKEIRQQAQHVDDQEESSVSEADGLEKSGVVLDETESLDTSVSTSETGPLEHEGGLEKDTEAGTEAGESSEQDASESGESEVTNEGTITNQDDKPDSEWDGYDEQEAEERMNIIAQNGNDGLHYDEVEEPTEDVREKMRDAVERLKKKQEKPPVIGGGVVLSKTDDKVIDNQPRGIRGWLLSDKQHKED